MPYTTEKERMGEVAVTLRGGLGNQLFQWAIALELRARGHSVSLDPRLLKGRSPMVGDVSGLRQSRWPSFGWMVSERLELSRTLSGYRKYLEPAFTFSSKVFDEVSRNHRLVLHGYWQSQRYFPSVHRVVRERLQAHGLASLTASGRKLADTIGQQVASVSVHVRRGDYCLEPARSVHGLLDVAYFRMAMRRLRERGAGSFYVFSDDLDWSMERLDGHDIVPVKRGYSVDASGDLYLMSLCANHVLSNSSFSWWGTWLGGERSDQVYAPEPWFRSGIDARDLLVDGWCRLPAVYE